MIPAAPLPLQPEPVPAPAPPPVNGTCTIDIRANAVGFWARAEAVTHLQVTDLDTGDSMRRSSQKRLVGTTAVREGTAGLTWP